MEISQYELTSQTSIEELGFVHISGVDEDVLKVVITDSAQRKNIIANTYTILKIRENIFASLIIEMYTDESGSAHINIPVFGWVECKNIEHATQLIIANQQAYADQIRDVI